jgi:hypothetical protein
VGCVANGALRTYLECMAKLGPARDSVAAELRSAQVDALEDILDQALDETLDESFPASDPPSWTLGNGTAATKQRSGHSGQRSSDEPLHPLQVRSAQPPTAGR